MAVGAVAAAIPNAVAAPTGAAADPIYAAIGQHRRAQAVHLAAIDEFARLEKCYGVQSDDVTKKARDDANESFGLLIGMAATTAAGLLAKISYLREIARHQAWMLDEREGTALELIESFAGSIRTIWGMQQ
jgi:hypothetical protein